MGEVAFDTNWTLLSFIVLIEIQLPIYYQLNLITITKI
jgi:hypothetical protein